MYRIEVSRELKTLAVVMHGMQDGVEGKMMRIDLANRVARLDESWSLILDYSEFEKAVPVAMKQVKTLAAVFAAHAFRKRILIPSEDPAYVLPYTRGSNFTIAEDFDSAWEMVGGTSRSMQIEPPADGTRYPANTFPPAVAK